MAVIAVKIRTVFIGLSLSAVMLFPSWGQEERAVTIRKVPLQELYKKVLDEKKALEDEKKALRKDNETLIARANLYIEKIKDLTKKNEQLTAQLDAAAKEAVDKSVRLEEEIGQLRGQTEELETLFKKEGEASVYDDGNLKKIERELTVTLNKVQEYANELAIVKKTLNAMLKDNEAIKKENGKVHYNLGNVLLKQGDYKRAAYEYELALPGLPGDPDVYHNLAVIYDYYLDDNQKALGYYKLYLENVPDAKDSFLIKERIVENRLEKKMRE
ncbi:MAG: hypothetical protein ABH858_06155 [Candidatus Omnitrophota bacterium]